MGGVGGVGGRWRGHGWSWLRGMGGTEADGENGVSWFRGSGIARVGGGRNQAWVELGRFGLYDG